MRPRQVIEHLVACLSVIVGLVLTRALAWRIRQRSGVLVVRGDALGDFVLSAQQLRYVRQRYPQERIAVLVRGVVADAAKANPAVDEVIVWDYRRHRINPFYRLMFLWRLSSRGHRIVVCPVYSRSPFLDEVVCWAGASERIGCVGDLSNHTRLGKLLTDRVYSRLISVPQVSTEMGRNRAFVKEWLDLPEEPELRPEVCTTTGDTTAALELLEDLGLNPGQFVALSVGAGARLRVWSPANYAAIIRLLHETYRLPALVLAGPGEEDLLDEIRRLSSDVSPSVLPRYMPIGVVAEVLRRAQAFVGNESGLMHVAAAVGTRGVGIVGGGHFGRFFPYACGEGEVIPVFHEMPCYHCNWMCQHSQVLCITNIQVDQVWKTLTGLLEGEL